VHRVLIVEDHPAIQASYALLLEREPDLVICAVVGLGREALERMPELAPDVVLVDLSLPDMDGFDLVRRLRESRPGTPVLVVSGYDAARRAERAAEAGAAGYVDKMNADSELVPAIRRAVAAR
jgi:DNA-binding NarL/FixJ family response regulator